MSEDIQEGQAVAAPALSEFGFGQASSGASRSGVGRITDWLEAQALFVAAVAVTAVVCLVSAGTHLMQDAYLALVDGRVIAMHGIPHYSYLTVMAYGVRWVDQQWLAQLAFYELFKLGGYALLVFVDVVLVSLGIGLAIAAAHSLGASERQVIRGIVPGTFFYIVVGVTIRSQVFAYPLFVATLWLLAAEVRKPTRMRVFLVFPMLVLWANLHGSVTLGVGLAMLYGLTLLVRGVREHWLRAVVFIVGPPLCLLLTPYGFSIVHYFHATLFNSEFSKLVTEWKPVFSVPLIAALYLPFVVWGGWLLYRGRKGTPLFDWLVLILLAVAGVDAVRNIVWIGLATIVLLPTAIARTGKHGEPMPKRRKLNLSIAYTMLALLAITVVATFAHPDSWFQKVYDNRGIAAVESLVAKNPSAKIWPDVHYGDWLLLEDPKLAGHVAYDTSFELLPTKDLAAFASFYDGRLNGYAGVLGPYSVLVLDPANKKESRTLLALPGVHVVLRTKRIIVATKPTT